MYKVSAEFNTVEELQIFVSALSSIKLAVVIEKPVTEKPTAELKKEKVKAGVKLANDDGSPLVKDDEMDKARVYLRAKAKPINEFEGAKHLPKTREALAEQGGAKSITLMEAQYFVAFDALLDKIGKEIGLVK